MTGVLFFRCCGGTPAVMLGGLKAHFQLRTGSVSSRWDKLAQEGGIISIFHLSPTLFCHLTRLALFLIPGFLPPPSSPPEVCKDAVLLCFCAFLKGV